MISLGGGSVQAAETLGRLFFTPAQRASLDAANRLKTTGQTAPAKRGPAEITLNGIVVRSDGESTVWINGQPAGRGAAANVVATPSKDPSSARVSVPGSVSTELRVGQQLDTRTGAVRETFAQQPRAAKPKVLEGPVLQPPPASGAAGQQ
jgi:hypothetical protein